MSKQQEEVYQNPNGMPMANGKNLHMDLGVGDINNRIVTVGTTSRAEKIAKFLDDSKPVTRIASGRGFLTINGTFNDVPVSIVAIGMGPSMMDFFVRETKAVVPGPIVACRFGTCGGISDQTVAGTVVVASGGSSYVTRNPDYFAYRYADEKESVDSNIPKYNICKVAPSDSELSSLVETQLKDKLKDVQGMTPEQRVLTGTNVTAESFYSSQGRIHEMFDDQNDALITEVCQKVENAATMEMETFMLLHLAKCCNEPFYASSCAIVVANRTDNSTVDGETLGEVERLGGLAVLEAVTMRQL
jgi:uridine phosphorylase